MTQEGDGESNLHENINDIQFDKRKKELEIQKLINENLKLLAEKQKIIYETRILRKQGGLFLGMTFDSIGKIILGAGSMAFAVALYIYPYFNLKQAELEAGKTKIQSQRDSLAKERDLLQDQLVKGKQELKLISELKKEQQAVIENLSGKETQIKLLENLIGNLIDCLPAKVDEFSIINGVWDTSLYSGNSVPPGLEPLIKSCFFDIKTSYNKSFKGRDTKEIEIILNGTEKLTKGLMINVAMSMMMEVDGKGVNVKKEDYIVELKEKLKPLINDAKNRVTKVIRNK